MGRRALSALGCWDDSGGNGRRGQNSVGICNCDDSERYSRGNNKGDSDFVNMHCAHDGHNDYDKGGDYLHDNHQKKDIVLAMMIIMIKMAIKVSRADHIV